MQPWIHWIFYESTNSCGPTCPAFLWISNKFFNIVVLKVCVNSAAHWDGSDSPVDLRSSLFTLGSGFPWGSLIRLKLHLPYLVNQRPTLTFLVEPSTNTLLTLRTVSAAMVPRRNSYSKKYVFSTYPLFNLSYIFTQCNIKYKSKELTYQNIKQKFK